MGLGRGRGWGRGRHVSTTDGTNLFLVTTPERAVGVSKDGPQVRHFSQHVSRNIPRHLVQLAQVILHLVGVQLPRRQRKPQLAFVFFFLTYIFILLITFPSRCTLGVLYTMLVQRFEPQGMRFTNVHYYY